MLGYSLYSLYMFIQFIFLQLFYVFMIAIAALVRFFNREWWDISQINSAGSFLLVISLVDMVKGNNKNHIESLQE